MNSLVSFWKRFEWKGEAEARLYAHQDDTEFIRTHTQMFDQTIRTHQSFVTSDAFGNFKDTKFHLSLLPVPYLGDLQRADIYILLLNPGFGLTEYADDADPFLRERLAKTLTQNLNGAEFPFCKLDPALCRTAGFRYWEPKLRALALLLSKERKISYLDSLKEISTRFACIQLVPYHSTKFVGGTRIRTLPSSIAAVEFVQSELKRRAENGDAVIVVTRQSERWGLDERPNAIVVYRGTESFGASLSPNSPGGEAILNKLRKYRSPNGLLAPSPNRSNQHNGISCND